MTLIDKSASRTSGVGARYQQLLSIVAHGQPHGLSRFLIHAPSPADPSKVISQMNVTGHDLALHLLAGPPVRRYARPAPALVLRVGHQRSRRDHPRHDARLGSHSRSAVHRAGLIRNFAAGEGRAVRIQGPSPGGLVRVGDLDDVQRLVEVPGVLAPLRGVESEDGADRRVGDGGHVGVPRVQAGPGDDGR